MNDSTFLKQVTLRYVQCEIRVGEIYRQSVNKCVGLFLEQA